MNEERGRRTILAMAAALIAVFAVQGSVQAADAKEYGYTVISGHLRDPETKGPMVGATIRLVEAETFADAANLGDLEVVQESVTDREGRPVIREGLSTIYEAVTDADGRFEFSRLPLNRRWRLEILMATGELIRATSLIDISSGRAELILGITKRIDRAAEVDTDPQAPGTRWVIPGLQPPKWKRFWKQFAIFVGGAGVLAL